MYNDDNSPATTDMWGSLNGYVQPDNAYNADCAEVQLNLYIWVDTPCGADRNFICAVKVK